MPDDASSTTTNNALFKRLIRPVSDGFRSISAAMRPVAATVAATVRPVSVAVASAIGEGATATAAPSSFGRDAEGRWSWKVWVILIIILGAFGINLFSYLASGSQEVSNILGPLIKLVAFITLEFTKRVVNLFATITTKGVGAINTSVTNVVDRIESSAGGSKPPAGGDALTAALTRGAATGYMGGKVEFDDADSNIQQGGKAGYCYIGTERGVRNCAEVGVNDTCQSAQIYPSLAVCINPSLRA